MNATQLETQGHSSIKGLCMESGAEHATQLETQGHRSKAYVWNQGLNIHVLHKSSTYIYTCRNASNCATFRLCKFICIYVHVYITGLTMLLNSAIVLLVTRRPSTVYHIYDSRVQSSHTQSHSADYNNYNDRLCTITTCTLNKQPSIIQISRLQDFSSLLNRLAK